MSFAEEDIVFKDFPPGPLDRYRKQATFDWKKLKMYMEDETLLKLKVKIFLNFLQSIFSGFWKYVRMDGPKNP